MAGEKRAADTLVQPANPICGDTVLAPRHLNKKTNALYKTEICRNWDESGECRYGRSCQFAHGGAELRTVQRHCQWKTKTCLAWINGGCTYGSRCCYAREPPLFLFLFLSLSFGLLTLSRRDYGQEPGSPRGGEAHRELLLDRSSSPPCPNACPVQERRSWSCPASNRHLPLC